jgi:hypothetical protein
MKRTIESNIVPLLIVIMTIWVIVLIPFKIIGYGFLPPDDALWHSAKVISGKNWADVLVLRPDIKIESHPGWHYILGIVHNVTKCDTHSLVLFSVVSLFILFTLIPIFFLRRPEAWLAALIAISMANLNCFFRLFLGRPYIITMAALLCIFLLWPKLKDKKVSYPALIFITILIAVSTWIHRTFYIFLIPTVAFFLAREWKAGIRMIICTMAGVFIGAAITGHPLLFIKQTILHLMLVSKSYETQNMLVIELRSMMWDFNIIMLVSGMLFWRALRGKWDKSAVDNPIFIVILLSFVAGLVTRRIWIDVGIPALAIWMAREFEDIFTFAKINIRSLQRLAFSAILAGVLYISITTDVNGRWTTCRPTDYISDEDPAQKEWLPGSGGILYSYDMGIFFRTVYKNPHGDWRYILGSEAAIMPEEDLKILRGIQKSELAYASFEPWVKKMRPEDRLVIGGSEDRMPNIPALEWKYAARWTWIGKKPNTPQK